jgi:hypothetical protein
MCVFVVLETVHMCLVDGVVEKFSEKQTNPNFFRKNRETKHVRKIFNLKLISTLTIITHQFPGKILLLFQMCKNTDFYENGAPTFQQHICTCFN